MQFAFSKQLLTTFDSLDYMHHANPKTPIEETMRALVELKA
jgi:aryl-alcohol dehydrogenase-like predicted oxidoreductase